MILLVIMMIGGEGRNRAVHRLLTVNFQAQIYEISPINARVFSLLLTFPNEPIAYPLTEGSTETFTEGFSENCPCKSDVVMALSIKVTERAERRNVAVADNHMVNQFHFQKLSGAD